MVWQVCLSRRSVNKIWSTHRTQSSKGHCKGRDSLAVARMLPPLENANQLKAAMVAMEIA
jgi:hypothetical protein